MSLKIGDVVYLNGQDHQLMTVESIPNVVTNLVECAWFDAKSRLRRGEFRVEILSKVTYVR